MEWVTQAEMDALATLANNKLLPIVNNPANADWKYSQPVYDRYTDGIVSPDNWIVPQPDYAFAGSNFLSEFNRIFNDAFQVFNGDEAWVGGNKLLLNPAAVCSGPWVVGVNDPDTWPMGGIPWAGFLQGSGAVNGELFALFTGVKFWSQTAPVGIDTCRYLHTLIDSFFNPSGFSFGPVGYSPEKPWVWNCRITALFYGPSQPDISSITINNVTATVSIVWSIEPTATVGKYLLVGTIDEYISAAGTITGGAGTPGGGIGLPAGYAFDEGYGCQMDSKMVFSTATNAVAASCMNPAGAGFVTACADIPANSDFVLNGEHHKACWILSDSTLKGVWTAKTLPCPGLNVFLDQDMPPYIGRYGVETSALNGSIQVGIAGNNGGQAFNPVSNDFIQASSMRQPAPIGLVSWGGGSVYGMTTVDGINSVQPSISCRPAKWLVRRDTDFVPFELGFNSGISTLIYSSQVSTVGDLLLYYDVSVPPNCTGVKIRLLQTGAIAGWKNGVFQYGEPLAKNLTILVKKTGYPTTTDFDFRTDNNQVNITGAAGSDGGAGYLASVLNNGFTYAIQNNNEPGTSIAFDVYVELDFGTPKRVYFPPIGECFSYCLDGTPGKKPLLQSPDLASKPIPQSGYCIFKLRATRLPVANGSGISITPESGAALTITVGQNLNELLQTSHVTFAPLKNPDGSNMTITIPANARDSGDVAAFIPVLAGNELVYQCSEQVIFEAWANWQPIFFNTQYGTGQYPYDPEYGFNAPNPSVFTTALSFFNRFNVTKAGYPIGATAVQFPLFRELYDDLMVLLGQV